MSARKSELRLVVETVIPEQNSAAGRESGEEIGDDDGMFERVDGRQHENHGNDVDGRSENVILKRIGMSQVANKSLGVGLGRVKKR